MQTHTYMPINEVSRAELNIIQLCNEVDEWKEAAAYWKDMYEKERDERNNELNESLERSKKAVGQAISFALSVREGENGSLVIDRESRAQLAEQYKD